MHRLAFTLLALSLLGASARAHAANPPARAARTKLAAYTAASQTRIHVTHCRVRGAAPEAVANNRCARQFKITASRRVCSRLGKGKHPWFYTVQRPAIRRRAVVLCL